MALKTRKTQQVQNTSKIFAPATPAATNPVHDAEL